MPANAATTPGPRPRPRSRCRGCGRRSRRAAAANPRTLLLGSHQPLLEALSPRRVAKLPAQLPFRLGVGETAPLGHHQHRHVTGDLPGQPARVIASEASRRPMCEVGQPSRSRGWFVVDDIENAPRLLVHGQCGCRCCVHYMYPRCVATATPTSGNCRLRTRSIWSSVAPGP